MGDAHFSANVSQDERRGSRRTSDPVREANLEAVQRLCDRCIWLDGGRLRMDGDPDAVVRAYLENGQVLNSSYRLEKRTRPNEPVLLTEAAVLNGEGEPSDSICYGEPFAFRLRWDVTREVPGAVVTVHVRDAKNVSFSLEHERSRCRGR